MKYVHTHTQLVKMLKKVIARAEEEAGDFC